MPTVSRPLSELGILLAFLFSGAEGTDFISGGGPAWLAQGAVALGDGAPCA